MAYDLNCFKAYDIRGKVPAALNADIMYAVGKAFVRCMGAQNVVVGHDARLSGPELENALTAGLQEAGAQVTSIGLCGTEEIYYAAFAEEFDGGLMLTGSHNPADENGLKLVRGGAIPISGDSGLRQIREETASILARGGCHPGRPALSAEEYASYRVRHIRFLLDFTGAAQATRTLRIHADPGNGCAGLMLEELAPYLPHTLSFSNIKPDGAFPNGVPNPLLPEKRAATARAVRAAGADMGVAWDGDFDRCFFYDEQGRFIEGYYLVGLLAESLLARYPGAKVIHDPRLIWNTQDVVRRAGGVPLMSKTGHAFIKERMRAEDAVYGGEMSAHHYFRDFAYCDSGMIPWLLVAGLVAQSGRTLAELLEERMAAYPCSGEINTRVPDTAATIKRVRARFCGEALREEHVDGLSLEYANWRFNLRASNTEPLLRLNVETRKDRALLEDKTGELLRCIRSDSAEDC